MIPTKITMTQANHPGTPARTNTPKRAAQTPAVAAADRSISPKSRTTVIPTARVAITADCMNRL